MYFLKLTTFYSIKSPIIIYSTTNILSLSFINSASIISANAIYFYYSD